MAPKPETEDGLGPRELKSVSISRLVSELRDSFPSGEFDRVEEALVAREARLGAELEEKRREIGSLKERIAFERLERIKAELELKRVREERGDERLVKNDGFGLDDGEIVVKNEKCKLESVGGVESGKVGVWGEKERKVCEEGKRVVGINGSVPLKRNEGGGLGASGGKLGMVGTIDIEDSDEDECNSQATLDKKETTSCAIIDDDHRRSSVAFQKNLLTGVAETIGNLKRKFASSRKLGTNVNVLDGLDSDTSSSSSSSSTSSGSFDMDSLPLTSNKKMRADATNFGLNFSRRMAPPAKQPARKRKSSVPASPETPPYDSYHFLSADHEQRYRVIEYRNLLPERKVVLNPNEYEDFQKEIKRRKWTKLSKYPAPANVAIVKEFYANAMKIEEGLPTYKSFVRGKEISYSGQDINRFLGTELNLGPVDCEYVEWCSRLKDYSKVIERVCRPGGQYVVGKQGQMHRILRKNLLPLAQIWMSFIHSNISPCSHTSDITKKRSFILYAIMAGLSIDVGNIIAQEIHITANAMGTGQLGHPSLITELCKKAGVDVSEPPFQKPRQPINGSFILQHCMGNANRTSSSRAPPPTVPRTLTQRVEVLEADQLRSHQKLDALYEAQVMMMDSMQSLALHIPPHDDIQKRGEHVADAEHVEDVVAEEEDVVA